MGFRHGDGSTLTRHNPEQSQWNVFSSFSEKNPRMFHASETDGTIVECQKICSRNTLIGNQNFHILHSTSFSVPTANLSKCFSGTEYIYRGISSTCPMQCSNQSVMNSDPLLAPKRCSAEIITHDPSSILTQIAMTVIWCIVICTIRVVYFLICCGSIFNWFKWFNCSYFLKVYFLVPVMAIAWSPKRQ